MIFLTVRASLRLPEYSDFLSVRAGAVCPGPFVISLILRIFAYFCAIMNIRTVFISAVLLLTAFAEVRAAQEWSLRDCIEYAWEHNLSIKQQEIQVRRSENELLKSKLDFVPSFNASVGYNLNWGRSVDLQNLEIIKNKLTQGTSAQVTASISVLDGLSKYNTLRGNKVALSISLQEVERLKDEISVSITQAFLQILLSEKILEAARESFASIQAQRDRTAVLVEAGSQPYSSLLEIESQVASERMQLVTAGSQVTENMLALRQLLDLGYDTAFAISAPDIDFMVDTYTPENIDEIYASALSMPRIRGAELELQKSIYDLKISQGRFYPTISVAASYGTFYSSTSRSPIGAEDYTFFNQLRDNINPTLGFSLSIPIFNSWSVRTEVKNARLNRDSKEIELMSARQQLYKDIQTAVTEAGTYWSKYVAAEANMKAMEESFRYVEEKFGIGVLNATDYTVSRTNLFKARSEYLQAKYQFVFQLKIIDFYKGIPISL